MQLHHLTLYSQHQEVIASLLSDLFETEWGALNEDQGLWLQLQGLRLHFMPLSGAKASEIPNEHQCSEHSSFAFQLSSLQALEELWQKLQFLQYRYQLALKLERTQHDQGHELCWIDPDGRRWRFLATVQ